MRRGAGSLDVAAVLWERLLLRHGLKTVAQKGLADLMVSLRAELALGDDCPRRLRLVAEMIGLGVEADATLRGLVITGREPLSFAAGADVKAIEAVTSVEDALELVRYV